MAKLNYLSLIILFFGILFMSILFKSCFNSLKIFLSFVEPCEYIILSNPDLNLSFTLIPQHYSLTLFISA